MRLVIVGASGHGMETLWLARRLGLEVAGFLDDTPEKQGTRVLGVPVLGPVSESGRFARGSEFIVAVGSPRGRASVVERLRSQGTVHFATLVDPAAVVPDVVVGPGSMICAGVVATVAVTLGEHVIVNRGSTLGHGARLGSFVTVAPLVAISGDVNVDEMAEIGTGAAIREKTSIGRGAVVGMGGVVVEDVPAGVTVVGNPARPLQR